MNRGFTLFEMLVSLGIFMLLTTTLLVKNSQFKGNVVIGNTAYQLALAFREAQSYGVNVRGVDPSTTGTPTNFVYNTAYGVHFDSLIPSSYLLFGDTNPSASGGSANVGDRQYTSALGSVDALVRTYQIGSGTEVVMFCTLRSTEVLCSNSGSGTSRLTWLDVSFLRPQLSAAIRDSSQTDPASQESILYAASALVVVKNAQGICKAVKVTKAGSVGVVENPKELDGGTTGYGKAVIDSGLCP
ncbi:MAG: prepilin-type N-terminal cleavage/methylation domain-containing protein [bacterium]